MKFKVTFEATEGYLINRPFTVETDLPVNEFGYPQGVVSIDLNEATLLDPCPDMPMAEKIQRGIIPTFWDLS